MLKRQTPQINKSSNLLNKLHYLHQIPSVIKRMKTRQHTALILIFIPIIIGLTGCIKTSHTVLHAYQQYPSFTLSQPITFSAGKTKVYFQHGNITQKIDQYEKHCRIEKRSLKETPYTIQPSHFMVTQYQLGIELFAQHSNPALYAMALANRYSDYEPPETMDVVHFYLHSAEQPDVYRLSCAGSLSNGSRQDYPRSVRPNTQEINAILGGYGQLVTGEK